jgi:formylmethanofuran dehydrogenase subunit E
MYDKSRDVYYNRKYKDKSMIKKIKSWFKNPRIYVNFEYWRCGECRKRFYSPNQQYLLANGEKLCEPCIKHTHQGFYQYSVDQLERSK